VRHALDRSRPARYVADSVAHICFAACLITRHRYAVADHLHRAVADRRDHRAG